MGNRLANGETQPVDSAGLDCSVKSFAFLGNLRKCRTPPKRRLGDFRTSFNVNRFDAKVGEGRGARNLLAASPKQFYTLYAPTAFRKGGRINFLEKIFRALQLFQVVKIGRIRGLVNVIEWDDGGGGFERDVIWVRRRNKAIFGDWVKFSETLRREEREVLYCRNPRRDGRRRNASATCDSPPFDARFRSSRRSASPRPFAVGESGLFVFARPERGRDCRGLPAISGRPILRAFAASFYRFAPKYPFIPNGLRFDLSTAFRRGASDSSRRRPDRRSVDFRRKRRRLKSLKNVGERGKGACDSFDKETCETGTKNDRRLDFDATTRETLVPQVASRRGIKRSGGREGTREYRFA